MPVFWGSGTLAFDELVQDHIHHGYLPGSPSNNANAVVAILDDKVPQPRIGFTCHQTRRFYVNEGGGVA